MMKKAKGTETDNRDSSIETESLVANTTGRICDQQVGKPPIVFIMFEEVAWQICSKTGLFQATISIPL